MPKTHVVITPEATAALRADLQYLAGGTALRIGCDFVQIGGLRHSVETLCERFTERLFTAGEVACAHAAPVLVHERLAARFAAKEAAIKASGLTEAGRCWRDIEVCKLPGALHAGAAWPRSEPCTARFICPCGAEPQPRRRLRHRAGGGRAAFRNLPSTHD